MSRRADERIRLSLDDARRALSWSAALQNITAEDLALAQRLAEHVARFSAREEWRSIRRQLRAAGKGWRPRCPMCGRDAMEPIEGSPGDFICRVCKAYCGQDPEKDLTPFQAWLAQIRWARERTKPGASSGSSSGRRPRRGKAGGPALYADEDD